MGSSRPLAVWTFATSMSSLLSDETISAFIST